MYVEAKNISRKKRPSISDFNKYLINSIENSDNSNKINNSFTIFSANPLKSLRTFNNPNKKLLLEKFDTSNYDKNKKKTDEIKSFRKINSNNYDNSEDLFMAKKLTSSFLPERTYYKNKIYYPKKMSDKYKICNTETDNYLINNNTKEKTNSTTFDNDIIIEPFPLEKYNRKMEYISSVIKIQSYWRKYRTNKKIRIYRIIKLIEKIIYKKRLYFLKLLFVNLSNKKTVDGKIYYKKLHEKKLIKKNIRFHIIKSIHNKKLTIDKKPNEKSISILKALNNKELKISNLCIKFLISFEKYIKNKVLYSYKKQFFENLKIKGKVELKQKQTKILYKLINYNNMKILRNFMNIYKKNIAKEKQTQNVYYSLINPKLNKENKTKLFNFQACYKQNILADIIKKYGYTSIIQKYYLIWKKNSENNIAQKNKKKRVIKIKKVKKNNFEENKNFNNLKIDTHNVSTISNNMSYSSINTLNSIQTINGLKICLTSANKKMRVKRIAVDQNYYKNIENNNNYNI